MKNLKKLLVICLTIIMGVCVAAFVACKPGANTSTEPVTLTLNFTVTYEDGTAVEGARIVVCNKTNGVCDAPVKTGADGKVSVTKDIGEYTAHVIAPTGYSNDDGEVEFSANKTEYTFILKVAA
ncbi:MAG: hypothetical protein J6B04_06105 [Clostridia bacterium]|nr:hypothetical protein [Clostridia bacterium]